jgi:hypothetical protein
VAISRSRKFITLVQASKRLPGHPHLSTLHRWRTRGVNGIRLITKKVGHRRVVALSDLESFIEAVTAAADGTPAPVRTAKQRQRDIDRAERELARDGVGPSLRPCKVQANRQRAEAQNPNKQEVK